jgi:hypothetical protein
MGTIHHNVVIATTWDEKRFKKAIKWLDKNSTFPYTTLDSNINGYHTIFLGPDGSKEYWASSDHADRLRDKFISFIDHEGFWDWLEVGYGELGQSILRGNNGD